MKSSIPFVKAHACGNDFLVVREEQVRGEAFDALARRLCCRNRGIGADGVEFFASRGHASGALRLYNSDGSTAEISGNGTRCAAAWLAHETGGGAGDEIVLETDAGPRVCRIVSRQDHLFLISSAMGSPAVQERSLTLAGGRVVSGAVVLTGNPHFVIFVERADFSLDGRSWQSTGEEIAQHASFPKQTNVEFVRMLGADEIEIRIFERGAGPTASSGTGACASAAAAIRLRGAAGNLSVTAPGGRQTVRWRGGADELELTGPAELICRGEFLP